jgi:hypothetical protein
LEQFKTESTNNKKCTLEEKLGAFLVVKDTLFKGAKEKEIIVSNANQGESTLSLAIPDPAMKQKGGNRTQHYMLAMDGNEQVTCISCGFPTLRAFGPEKLLRFGKKDCCSSGCFITYGHYKDEEEVVLQSQTVKVASDSLRAATSLAIKTMR